MKLLQQNRQKKRTVSSDQIPENSAQQQHPSTEIPSQYNVQRNNAQRNLNAPDTTQQYDNPIQQTSFAYQNQSGDLAQVPVSNPGTTSPPRFDNPNQQNFVPQRNSNDTGFVPIPPALAPAAEIPNALNSPESIFNNPSNPNKTLTGADGLSLVPNDLSSKTNGNPGLSLDSVPGSNLLLQQPNEDDVNKSSFRERLNHFYTQHGLIPQSSSASIMVMAGSTDDIGFFDFHLQTTFAVESVPGLTISPDFQVDFLNGPTRTDLPPRLFNMGTEFRMAKPLTERTSYELAVRPAVYSDFEAGGSPAARVTGRGLGFYTWSTQTQLVYGLVFLNRKDISLLPVIGIIHIPRGDWRLELVFPRPRILKLISRDNDKEKWGYISGELGGGSWAIERPGRVDDVVTLSDLRLLLGFENRYANGRSWYFEVGLVFDREIQFETGPGNYNLDSTGMIRAGIIY